MDSLSPTQISVLALESLLVLAGIIAWIRQPREHVKPLDWGAPLTDTLMLLWAVMLSAFLGQLAGAMMLKFLPATSGNAQAVQAIIIVVTTDGAAIAAWLAVHAFLRGGGQPLPVSIEGPLRLGPTSTQGGVAFLRVLPVVMATGLAWGTVIHALGLPETQQGIVDIFEETSSAIAIAGLALVAVVLVPIAEELVFRAGLFRVLAAKYGRWPGILISSAVFAAIHMSWLGFAPLFGLGIVFCLAYERSRNIAVPMIAHGLFNLNSILLIVLPVPDFLK